VLVVDGVVVESVCDGLVGPSVEMTDENNCELKAGAMDFFHGSSQYSVRLVLDLWAYFEFTAEASWQKGEDVGALKQLLH
jgi:hypothetical protein